MHAKYFNQICNFNSKQSVQGESEKASIYFLINWQGGNGNKLTIYAICSEIPAFSFRKFSKCFPDVPQLSLCHRYVQWSSFSNQQRSQKRIDCSTNPPYSFHVYRVSQNWTIKFCNTTITYETRNAEKDNIELMSNVWN